jgi:hypothetical protein
VPDDRVRKVDPQYTQSAHRLQAVQLGAALVLMPVLYLLSGALPLQVGWENGALESMQNGLLGAAAVLSLVMAWTRRGHAQRSFWLAAALVWLLLLGRELSWGGVFMAPLETDTVSGPFYSSRVLAYKPLIPWLGLAVVLLAAGLVVHARVVRVAWQRRALVPWGALVAALAYGAAASWAEQAAQLVPKAQVMEELFETFAYLMLLGAHWWSFSRWLWP